MSWSRRNGAGQSDFEFAVINENRVNDIAQTVQKRANAHPGFAQSDPSWCKPVFVSIAPTYRIR